MKNTLKLFGIIAITALIGFAVACGDGHNPPPPADDLYSVIHLYMSQAEFADQFGVIDLNTIPNGSNWILLNDSSAKSEDIVYAISRYLYLTQTTTTDGDKLYAFTGMGYDDVASYIDGKVPSQTGKMLKCLDTEGYVALYYSVTVQDAVTGDPVTTCYIIAAYSTDGFPGVHGDVTIGVHAKANAIGANFNF